MMSGKAEWYRVRVRHRYLMHVVHEHATLDEAREVWRRVVELVNRGGSGGRALWDLMTALRGPDAYGQTAIKAATTEVIRRDAGLDRWGSLGRVVGIAEDGVAFDAGDGCEASGHFLRHARMGHAAALRLNPRDEP